MIVQLNLLPDQECRKLESEQLYAVLKREILFLAFLTVFVGTVLWYAGEALANNIEAMRASVFSSQERDQELVKNVTALNDTAKNISAVQDMFSSPSVFLLEFTSLTPAGIRVVKLSINGESVEITGLYRRREELLRFRSNLENGFLTEIEFPIQNLLKQEDGEFIIRGGITETVLEKMFL